MALFPLGCPNFAGASRLRLGGVAALLCIFLFLWLSISYTQFITPHFSFLKDLDPSKSLLTTTTTPPLPADWLWTRFAYSQYATNTNYLCNSVMMFEALHRLGSKADRLLLHSDSFTNAAINSTESRLLAKAQDEFGVKLVPIQVERHGNDGTWSESFTKLLIFNQTQYSRILHLDSDATLLRHMDELFFSPSSPVAMPRAYWLPDHTLTSLLVLVEPSTTEFNRVHKLIATAGGGIFDMEIFNSLYGNSAMILPHRPYSMLTGEFRKPPGEHSAYLGNDFEAWNPEKHLDQAKLVHFSDWPIRKPWLVQEPQQIQTYEPKCEVLGDVSDCRARSIWNELYLSFAQRRKEICGLELEQ